MSGVVVFAGPTLPPAEAEALLPCTALPPARQGDVWRAVQAHRPRAIGLIDGVFLHEPAVWHRELLWAMQQGVHVFGAASMGALRAAELAPYGMRGVGRVFAAYRDGVWPGYDDAFEDDDEVAVIHAPAELGAVPLSVAMVDWRDTLAAAEAAGVLDRAGREMLAAALKRLPFARRTLPTLFSIAVQYTDFTAWLPAGMVARKRLDATQMLREMAAFLASAPPPCAAGFRFQQPQVWADFLAVADVPDDDDAALALDELRLDPAAWHAAARAALGRHHALAALPPPPAGGERAALSAFRHARGLARRSDLDGWLTANAATPACLSRLMRSEAALSAALARRPSGLTPALLEHLRLDGALAPLLARAQARRTALAGITPGPGELDRAMAWHMARVRSAAGWASTDAAPPIMPETPGFRYTVWLAYRMARSGDA